MITRNHTGIVYRSEAVFSDCERYRYSLTYQWGAGRLLLFVMLNPSTATERNLDPTVQRCVSRAERAGYGAVGVANLFALRSTDPDELLRADDAIGEHADVYIGRMLEQASDVICAWGNHRAIRGRGAEVMQLIREKGHAPLALKINKDGSPGHPLYIAHATQPVPMEMAA